MTTNFDTSLDSFTRPTDSDSGNDGGATDATVVIDNLMDAIEALEASVGISGSAVATSLRNILQNTSTGHDHDGADSKTVAYTNLTSVPSTFAPTAHAIGGSSHTGTFAFNDPEIASFRIVSRVTSDFVKTSNVTLGNVTGLSFAIGASEVWGFRIVAFHTSATAGNFRTNFTMPTSCTGEYGIIGINDGAASATASANYTSYTFGGTDGRFGGGASVRQLAVIQGVAVNSTNAGTIQLQAAQGASSGTASTIYSNSYIVAERLA